MPPKQACPRAEADAASAAVVSLHEAGDLAGALAAAEAGLARFPTHLDLLLAAGHALFALGRAGEAYDCFARLFQADTSQRAESRQLAYRLCAHLLVERGRVLSVSEEGAAPGPVLRSSARRALDAEIPGGRAAVLQEAEEVLQRLAQLLAAQGEELEPDMVLLGCAALSLGAVDTGRVAEALAAQDAAMGLGSDVEVLELRAEMGLRFAEQGCYDALPAALEASEALLSLDFVRERQVLAGELLEAEAERRRGLGEDDVAVVQQALAQYDAAGCSREGGDLLLDHARYKLRRGEDAKEAAEAASARLQAAAKAKDAEAWYNLACLAGLFGRVGPAQQALEKAVKLEPALAKDARTDPDFESVRSALAAG